MLHEVGSNTHSKSNKKKSKLNGNLKLGFTVTSSGIDKMFENFEPIFEQNEKVNFGPICVKSVNFVSIFKKSVNFGPIFEKSVNFEHFVNGR